MRISWNWLRRYADTDLTPQQAAEVLTSTGLETEGVEVFEPVKGMLEGVVVGHVLQREQHPDADRLSLCTVDLGEGGPVQIVCGAPNVAAGQKVLVATIGTTLHFKDGPITIKKSKIRGQESHGMICAEDELGLGESHEGILVLDPTAAVGTPAADHLGLRKDQVLEIGLTPNRTDAMGHVGVARDLIAALNHRRGTTLMLKWPDVSTFKQDDDAFAVKVEVNDLSAAPRYAGVTLTNIKVAPSPQWLQELLLAIGLKPINNVVDVTNFVQHELGTPLHAFDAEKLAGGTIIVRKAAENEQFTTLDGKERRLRSQDLVIADGEKPACIAGVFGGQFSGVSESTTKVFLESAVFDPSTIRSTARHHGLNTDASFRFERGVDRELTLLALKRAALLLKEIAGARTSSPITDRQGETEKPREVNLPFKEIERLTGTTVPKDEVVRILELLDFRISDRNDERLKVIVPGYRVDVSRAADVVEEVLRIHGFDNIPLPDRLMVPPVPHEAFDLESLRSQLGAHLAARGFREVMTPSLTASDRIGEAQRDHLVRLKNPLSNELDVLRPTMLTGILQAIAHNINRQQRDLAFFERGRIYRAKDGRAMETETLALAITGARDRESWRKKTRKADLFDMKEEIDAIMLRLGLSRGIELEHDEHAHLINAHVVKHKGRTIGHVGEVDPRTLKIADLSQPVFFAELNEQALLELCRSQEDSFQEIPRFPSVRRDLSLLLDADVRFDRLRKLAFNAERKLLREVDLFDVYQGEKLPAGKKSYAISFILQDTDRTLTDEQVEKAMGRIRNVIEKETGAELRG